MALVAFFHGMAGGKLLPVFLLIGGEHPCSIAQGAGVLKSGHNRIPDEFRPVWHVVQSCKQAFVGLERYYLPFLRFAICHNALPYTISNARVYYYKVIRHRQQEKGRS